MIDRSAGGLTKGHLHLSEMPRCHVRWQLNQVPPALHHGDHVGVLPAVASSSVAVARRAARARERRARALARDNLPLDTARFKL